MIDALGATRTTWFVAEDQTQSFSARYPESAERLLAAGHELAAHVHFQTSAFEVMADDVRAATGKLRALGAPCLSFRGGAHVFSDRLAETIAALGYRYDSSAVPGLVRRYHTRAGDTFAAYPHVWSAQPFWWRPNLLELPTASFPLTQPVAFLKKRFRVPLLVNQPQIFRARLDELAASYPAEHVPVVVLGHSFDLEREGAPDVVLLDKLRVALAELGRDPAIHTTTVAELGQAIATGKIDAALRDPPSTLTIAAAQKFTEHVTAVAEHPWMQRVRRRFFPSS